MRNIYLIFRRDYLGYVKAWGFWLSLAAVPALMLIGSMFALFAAQSSPVRYYTVIEPGQVYAEAIDTELARNETAAMAQELSDQMQLPEGIEEALQKEEELLEEMPLPGVPGHEKRRREAWLKIPRRARAAIPAEPSNVDKSHQPSTRNDTKK